MEKIKIPEIRFKGFNGEWEENKLSELAEFNPKSTLPNEFKYVDLESVVGTKIISCRKETRKSAPSRAQRLAKYGDLFYQTVRPYQKNNCVFNIDSNNYVFSTGYAQLRPYIDSDYLLNLIQKEKFVKMVLDNCTGTSYPAINSNSLSKIKIYSSKNYEEQKQIGNFFKNLDEKLEIEKEKYKKLLDFKKAMLEDMFPKEGENIPKIRFNGFNCEWKEVKFQDIYQVVLSGNRLPKQGLSRGNVPYIIARTDNNGIYMRILENTIDYNGNYMKKFPANSITFSIDNPNAIFVQNECFYTSNIMRVLHNEAFNKSEQIFFMYSLKKLTKGYDWSIKFSGPVVMNSNLKVTMSGLEINYKEIQKIGNFFKNLDDKIKQSSQRIKKIENFKSAMMEKMFV